MFLEFSEVLCIGRFLSLKQLECEKPLPLSSVILILTVVQLGGCCRSRFDTGYYTLQKHFLLRICIPFYYVT